MAHRGLLKHRHRLSVLLGRVKGCFGIARIAVIALAPDLNRSPPLGLAARIVGRRADRAGNVGAGRLASGEREPDPGRRGSGSQQTGGNNRPQLRSMAHGSPAACSEQ